MRASGSYSNQDAAPVEAAVAEALAALSNQQVRRHIARLAEKLAVLRASDVLPQETGREDAGR